MTVVFSLVVCVAFFITNVVLVHAAFPPSNVLDILRTITAIGSVLSGILLGYVMGGANGNRT